GIANPIGQTWTAAMMLEHLGEREAADSVVRAIEEHVADGGLLTRDLGGQADTVAVAGDLRNRVRTA
ncbi:MAG: isocitrate/isopropylmalate family dehydrogenase, partial [Acidobacteriota bacterium]|nr:isocitrate/isopropylmalate family dehydrogenase [Acidobacteriota bacterium]